MCSRNLSIAIVVIAAIAPHISPLATNLLYAERIVIARSVEVDDIAVLGVFKLRP